MSGEHDRQSTAEQAASMGPALVSLESIGKSFGKVRAVDSVDLHIRPGKVHALLGENGAGKSTLMSILAGRYFPEFGNIRLDGAPVRFRSSKDAINAGIGMVYQHFMLVETMTVAENVLLGQEKRFFFNPREGEELTAGIAEEYGLAVDPRAKVGKLSMGEKQRVEILRLLLRNSRVFIFDEPTTVLTPGEVDKLFEAFQLIVDRGDKAVVFISHKLKEVKRASDEITVLRKGRVAAHFPEGTIPSQEVLADCMVGREVLFDLNPEKLSPGEVVLDVQGVSCEGLHNVDLTVRKGEIVAVAGVAGNGQKPLVEVVCGLQRPNQGTVTVLGTDARRFYASRELRAKAAYIPEDRLGTAACRHMNLVDNVLLTTRDMFVSYGMLKRKEAEEITQYLMYRFNVRSARPENAAVELSGGNLQKLILAREFYREPELIVAEQPTQGLDVAGAEEIRRRLIEARKKAGILLVTGDLMEALMTADRIVVMYRGRIVGTVERSRKNKAELIGRLMAGLKPDTL